MRNVSNPNPADLTKIADYYGTALAAHGTSAKGVDWNGEASQILRFAQLCKLFPDSIDFSVNDLGCGYGAFRDYLDTHTSCTKYTGIDISDAMIRAARQRFSGRDDAEFIIGYEPTSQADYTLASGLFNVRLNHKAADWHDYLLKTLDCMHANSSHGFAFNCLTSYSDADRMRGDLHYANPCELFDICKRRYSRNVALLHDYGLFEFTILVRKP